MLLSTNSTDVPSVSGHIPQHSNTHCELLTVGKTLIPLRIRVELLIIDTWDLVGIDRQQLVLFVPMTNEPSTPATINLLKEEAESAVCLGVNFAPINREALRDCRLHLGDGASRVESDVCGYSVAAVHDKGAFVHTGLGSGNEIFIGDSAGPGCVYMGIVMEDGREVLPFTGISVGVQ